MADIFKSRSVSRLISHRPYYNGRMVFIPFNHSVISVEMCFFPFGSVCKRFFRFIPDPMRFDICLINNINTIFITQIKPFGVIRIVRCPYGIYIKTFHYLYISQHLIFCNIVSKHRIVLMTVHSLQKNRLSV